MREIQSFVLVHLSQARISVNLKRFDQFAITYPLGYRTSVVAVFGGLALLWKKDRPAAEAILLHEIAHCKQGDVLIVGAGSLLQGLLERWYWLLLGLLPIPIAQAYDILQTWNEWANMRWDVWFNGSKVSNLLLANLSNYLVGDLLILIIAVVHIFWVILLPVVGIWISEIGADRYMAENVQSQGDIVRTFQFVRNKKNSFWGSLLTGLSHPSVGLRSWFAKHHEKPITWILPVLAFPLAYVLKVLIYLVIAVNSAWTPGRSWDSIAQLLKEVFASYLGTFIPLWLTMAAVVLLWPLIARYWGWFFNNQNQPANWSNYRQNLISAGVIGCLALASVGMSNSIYIPPEEGSTSEASAEVEDHQVQEPVQIGDLVLTVEQVEALPQNKAFQPDGGNGYLAVDVSLENKSRKTISFPGTSYMEVKDENNVVYGVDFHATAIAGEQTTNFIIAPGETVHQRLGYQVPLAAQKLFFAFSFNRDKVFVQIPIPPWPEYTVAPTPSAPTEDVNLTTYQVPEEWIKSRQEAGLPALVGDTTEDWLLLGEECASGVQESCLMDEVFLDVAIPMPTSQTTP